MDRKLVVIEDSDDDFEALLRSCRRAGFCGKLVRFWDVEAALTHLRSPQRSEPASRPTTVIIVDLSLPGMDGRELLPVLKTDESLREIPVVIYTTSSHEKDIAFCYRHYANAYHVKPMDIELLEREMRTLLDHWFEHAVTST